ncbi:hypothetical protein [Nostocoides sp. HKS02]|uniref:hypothetical protein n=1 Tax=Nostocoides sp. HKS02 TaxID=1813880 RepID=UPI0012B4788C|nr:hypothetical protein [Tetrasphaera sp. HKS02]QGN58065.1 hypothetical protein GKE56_09380 [Tetrasphaera sp. HKS02]
MSLTAALLGLVAANAATAATANASGAPQPFTITETIIPAAGVSAFTATGPLCPSGTFADDVSVFAPSAGNSHSNGLNLLIHTVYTCADGSGTFNMLKHVLLTFTDTGFTGTGPVQIHGGTGACAELSGQGVDTGARVGDQGFGNITGTVLTTG